MLNYLKILIPYYKYVVSEVGTNNRTILAILNIHSSACKWRHLWHYKSVEIYIYIINRFNQSWEETTGKLNQAKQTILL